MNDNETYLRGLLNNAQNDYKAFAYEAILIGATVSTLNIPDGARYAQLILETTAVGTAVRMLRNKSVTITSLIGIPLENNATIEIVDYSNLQGFQIIKVNPGTTTLHIEYFR